MKEIVTYTHVGTDSFLSHAADENGYMSSTVVDAMKHVECPHKRGGEPNPNGALFCPDCVHLMFPHLKKED